MRDSDVRHAVKLVLNQLHADDDDTRIIEEMGIWSATARIDIAVVNGELCGFELKSARDKLNRLPSQESIYSQVFDRVTLVTAENHLAGSLKIIPDWWGLSIASMSMGRVELFDERPATENPRVSASLVARLLWREEAVRILESYELARGYRSKSVGVLQDRLAEAVSLEDLKAEVRSALKRRAYN